MRPRVLYLNRYTNSNAVELSLVKHNYRYKHLSIYGNRFQMPFSDNFNGILHGAFT